MSQDISSGAPRFRVHEWKRDSRNPVLPPGLPDSFDCTRCMNPFAVRVGDEYYLFYAGGDTGWESQMTEYPNVIEENGQLRLFYCGNGYGQTGIGTARLQPRFLNRTH